MNAPLTTKAEIESMLSYWRERLANAVRPKHIKQAGERVQELMKQLKEMEK